MSDLMTIPYPLFVGGLFTKPTDRPGRMMHAAIGIVGEVHELLDADCRGNMIEEAGDLRFYIQAARNTDNEVDEHYAACEQEPYEGSLSVEACRACLRHHANEVLDMAKKWWVYEKPLNPFGFASDLHQLELALSVYLRFMGITDEQVERHNREKLSKRYPGGKYTNEAAQARADKAGE